MREINLRQQDFAAIADGILFNGGSLEFKARGGSMYPFVHDGDILTVKPVDANDLGIGDIVFCRTIDNRTFVHRIVKKRMENGEMLLLTRGDSSQRDDGWLRTGQVLGIVISLHRGREIFYMDKRSLRLGARLWIKTYPAGPLFIRLARKIKEALSACL